MNKRNIISYISSAALCSLLAVFPARADCQADPQWLPVTPSPTNAQPESPLADCSAYRWAWQSFLYITQTTSGGSKPDFLNYAQMDSVFSSLNLNSSANNSAKTLQLRPRTVEPRGPVFNSVEQAGRGGILVDQNRNAVYYAIHMNSTFVDFVVKNKLNQKPELKKTSPDAVFPVGSLELKSSWQIVEPSAPPPGYIIATAEVPVLKNDNGNIVLDLNVRRSVTVALLGLHVVGVIENHPEFIWASFEHDGLAPSANANPEETDTTKAINSSSFPLYQGGTIGTNANTIQTDLMLDDVKQSLSPPTSIYRVYPGSSKESAAIDDEVNDINTSIGNLFGSQSSDVRSRYRLVGAIWLKNGATDFSLNTDFSAKSDLLAGETAMSNVSIESFTQVSSPNCFSCHQTLSTAGLPPLRVSISHILPLFFSQ
jgi:hypothetical protein